MGSVFVAPRLYSADSIVLAHGLSCSAECEIFPDQGLNPLSPALAGRFFATEQSGKPHFIYLFLFFLIFTFIYLFSWCDGSLLQHIGSLIFIVPCELSDVACGI